MGKKAIVGSVAAILMVAAVVGTVVSVRKAQSAGGDNGSNLSTSSKSVSAFCQSTNYRDVCQRSLSAAVNDSATPIDVIRAAVNATIEELQKSFGRAGDLYNDGVQRDKLTASGLSTCKQLLADAVDELKGVFDVAADIKERAEDLRTWLSAVITYQDVCLDELEHPEVKETMKTSLGDSPQLSSNALHIVTAAAKIFEALELNLTGTASANPGRTLLDDRDSDGFPSWLSAGDRRLLAEKRELRGRPAAAVQGALAAKPNAVVAQDGSGQYKTINAAVAAIPKAYSGRWVIYVKAGVYKEYVTIKDTPNVFMYGDGPRRTIVTGNKNYVDGTTTSNTATFVVAANGFLCRDMGFQNTAGAVKHQAVALRVQGDMAAFYHCRFDAYQDTLYTQAQRQFYKNCVVSGTVDFIFGNGAAILQDCLLIVRKPMANQQCIVTAQGRTDLKMNSAIVLHNCRIVPDRDLFPDRLTIRSYLGRPWKQYSTTIIMESTIGDLIQPDGYMPWDGNFALDTLYYAEYNNRGPGAGTSGRVKWKGFHVIGRQEAMQWTTGNLIKPDTWLKFTGMPYTAGLRY